MTKGSIVKINNQVGVIVLTGAELGANLEDHSAIWFGHSENERPIVYTIPTEYLLEGPTPVLRH